MSYGLTQIRPSVPLTEEMLDSFIADHQKIPGERPMRESRLKWQKKLLESGEFMMCDWGICFCKEDKTWYRVNGQHSSYILNCLKEGKTPEGRGMKPIDAEFPDGIPVVIKEAYCDSLDELPDVFDMFDSKHSSRSDEDKLSVYMAQHDDVRFMELKLTGKVLKGIDWLRKNDKTGHPELDAVNVPDSHERGRLLNVESVRDFCSFASEHKNCPFPFLDKDALVACVYETWLPQTEQSADIVEALLYEAADESRTAGDQIRRGRTRKGHDAQYYWNKASKAVKDLQKVFNNDKKLLRKMIEEVMAEAEVDEETAA